MTYLDHAASTPVRPAVIAAMAEQAAQVGNPSSRHAAGRSARRVVEESRERLARALGVLPRAVVLTSGGTEADNLAVKGLFWAARRADPERTRVLVSAVEHPAVLEPARWLAGQGAEVVELPVRPDGLVDLAALTDELGRNGRTTALVSVMWVNNEIGTVQPVAEVAALARASGALVHTDAVQAVAYLPVDCGVADAVSLSGHKLGGPVGAGALLLPSGRTPVPVLHGGGHEGGLRSGTLDAAGALGLSLAVEAAAAERVAEAARLAELRDALAQGVLAVVPDAALTGPASAWARAPHVVHLRLPGCDADSLTFALDAAGVQASAGSACAAGVSRPSHVLAACGLVGPEPTGALRLSLGRTSSRADVEHLLRVLPDVVARSRAATLVGRS